MTPIDPRLVYVDMKTRRAEFHLNALEIAIKDWIDSKPYTITHYDDFDKAIHVCRIQDKVMPEIIPMLLGDFVCCLRAALDQLAWGLAHLPPLQSFNRTKERQISFLIFEEDNSTYKDRRKLFPSTVADIIDEFQPYRRGDDYRTHPLWQLNELWTMDKHRAIPMNSNSFTLYFPILGCRRYLRHFVNALEVCFPLAEFYQSPVSLEPTVSIEVLFGEHMGELVVSINDIRAMNNFVRDDVIPRFTGFFP